MKRVFLMLAAVLAPTVAAGHVSFDDPRAPAGSTYRAVFRIQHGCTGSPVRAVEVDIPEGVRNARAMPKAGWKLYVEPAHVRWTDGRVGKGEFDEFVLLAKLPDTPGTLYWKVSQICEEGRIDWAEVPQPGKSLHDYRTPAVPLEVLPAQDQHRAH